MTTSISPPVDDARGLAVPARRSSIASLLRRPSFLLSVVWLVVVVVASAFAHVLAPYDPLKQDVYASLQGPSGKHWLGTDGLGRDVLSRLMYGGPSTLLAALEVVLVALAIGLPLGILAGYVGGLLASVANRLADLFFALPALVVLMAIVSVFGRGVLIPMAALGVIASASFIRLVSACVRQVRGELFVDAARVAGVRDLPIVLRHVLPNVATPVIIQCTLTFGVGLLVQAGLGFLGLGALPPKPDWGAMVADSATYVSVSIWPMVAPGACIALTVMAVNFIGEGLQANKVDQTRSAVLVRRRRSTHEAVVDQTAALAVVPASDDTAPGAVLSVRHLGVTFGGDDGVVVIDDVSFDVGAGEIVGLVGESGCGKSVTALSIIGLLGRGGRVSRGSIRVMGTEVVNRPERELSKLRGAKVGYVPQEPMNSLDPCFTVASHLTQVIRRHEKVSRQQARARAAELLTLVEVPDPDAVLRRYPHQLSGGMAQRVLIAMALAASPTLLIADEPTTALDVTVQSEILDLLRSIQQRLGMAMLLVTHDLGVVADLCQRVVVMYAGEVVEEASAADLFAHPMHPYSAALLECDPELNPAGRALPTIEGEVPMPGRRPVGCRFRARCHYGTDECERAPIALTARAGRADRCIRSDELSAEGSYATVAEG